MAIEERFINLGYPRVDKKYDYEKEAKQLLDVLNTATKESDVQKYIKDNEKWFIPGSLFRDYDFGHHEAYISIEHPLGEKYRADYVLLGRNSIGYHIVLVEFEDINVDYHISTSNKETNSVEKGIIQIRDWKRWMDDNRDYFIKSSGLNDIAGNIPSWAISYCLVVSRRGRMDELANQMRGQLQSEMTGFRIVTYDRLVENTKNLSNGF